MSRVIVIAALLGLVGAVNSLAVAASAATPTRAEEVRSKLLAGQSVLLPDETTINNNLVLRGETVRGALVCKRCTFTGAISAPHARFTREVDLSGSTVRGRVDLESATFLAPVRFGPSDRVMEPDSGLQLGCARKDRRAGALFTGEQVNFAFSTFEDDADFEEATFCGPADFASARFRAAARFRRSDFQSDSLFPGIAFDQEAYFVLATLGGKRIDFHAARFGGVADFRQATLAPILALFRPRSEPPITFEDAVFGNRADFTQTTFLDRATFRDSRMAADGLFHSAVFTLPAEVKGDVILVSFDHAVVGGRLDFGEARLGGTIQSSAELKALTAAALSFHETDLVDPFTLGARGVSLRDLVARLDQLDHVEDVRDRIALLHVLESSAKARGDLDLANDAHYRLQELSAEDDMLPQRIADFAFYQYVAGYLVRPEIPLLWLIFIVLTATVVRFRLIAGQRRAQKREAEVAAPGPGDGEAPLADSTSNPNAVENPPGNRESQPRPADAPPNAQRDEIRPPDGLADSLFRAFSLTVGWREPSPVRRAELLIYALLVACILIALANTNPTLRDMIDAIQ